jgi:hypothetical protein
MVLISDKKLRVRWEFTKMVKIKTAENYYPGTLGKIIVGSFLQKSNFRNCYMRHIKICFCRSLRINGLDYYFDVKNLQYQK